MIGLIARPYPMEPVNASQFEMVYDSSFPKTNMINNNYGMVSRSDGSSGQYYTSFDLGKPLPVDTIAFLWNTVHPDAPCSVFYSDSLDKNTFVTVAAGNVAYAPATLTSRDSVPSRKGLLTLPDPITARYWGFLTQAAPQFQISRFFVGRGAKFAIGPQKATLGAKDMNASVTTEVGETRSQEDENLIRPVIGLSFEYGKQSEMEQVLGQYTLGLGVSKPLLICTDLTSPYIQDNTAFGRPEKVVTLDSSIYDVWSFEAVVTSLGV